jgi:hypothetical protein
MRPRSFRVLLVAVLALASLVPLHAASALGFWTGYGTLGSGTGAASAGTLDAGATPSAVVTGSLTNVVVSWSARTLSNGTAASGYIVKRYSWSGNTLQTITGGCTGTIGALTCTESSLPTGSWYYTVTPVYQNWRGTESGASGRVNTGPASMTLAKTLFGGTTPLPATTTGTVSGFAPGESISYVLDTGSTLAGSPATVDATGSASFSVTIPASAADGTHTVKVVGAVAAPSVAIMVDTTAPTISLAVSPTPNANGWNATSPVTVTPTISDGSGTGIASSKYTTDGTDPTTSGTAITVSGAISVATTRTLKFVSTDNAGNVSAIVTKLIAIDTVAPTTPTLAFSGLTAAYWSGAGTNVYYRPGAASGAFSVTASSSDTNSGIGSYTFPTLPTGWSGASGGTGIQTYSFSSPNPTAPSGAQTVMATDNAGNSASATFTATPDSTAPAGGSVGYANTYSTATSTSVTFATGTDGGSGLLAGSGLLQRATATLAAGVCGTFGAFATVVTNPTSPTADTTASGTCFMYQYLVSDNVGNQATYTSANVLKADSTAPVNALSITSPSNAYYNAGTGVLYYRSTVAGSFRFANAVTDAGSGPSSTTYPVIGTTGWTHAVETVSSPAGGPYPSTAFSWTASPSVPTAKSISSADAAGNTASSSVTFTSDVTGPSAGTVAYTNGVVNALSVPVTVSGLADAGSGVASYVIKRDVATLTTLTETCGTFPGTYATTVTLSGGNDTSVASGSCYKYEIVVTDNVGNTATFTSTSVAKVDTSGPQVSAVTSVSVGGGTSGKLEVGDKLVITFNQGLATASVPSTFAGATEINPGVLSNVTLSIPGFTNGALSTGSWFYMAANNSTATFAGTAALVNNGTSTTVTLTVTSLTGGATNASTGALVFKPATTLTDGGGDAAQGSFTTAANFALF